MVIAGAISQAFGTKTPDLRLLQVLLLPSSSFFLLRRHLKSSSQHRQQL
jgi:hypothetical protein